MKAITLYQPWATLIADGVKTLETRSWRPYQTLIGERIAIHAGKRSTADYFLDGPTRETMRRNHGVNWSREIPFSAVVCTARLAWAGQVRSFENEDHVWVGCNPESLIKIDPYGDFSIGRWLWFLEHIRPLNPPVPARGSQGLWNWVDCEPLTDNQTAPKPGSRKQSNRG